MMAALSLVLTSAVSIASATVQPPNALNITLYGLRPLTLASDIINKDTADPAGDIFFYFGDRLLIDTACRNDPSWYMCKDQKELSYDSVYDQYIVEVDQTFGGCPSGAPSCTKYGACNPVNGNTSDFSCRPTYSSVGVANVSERYSTPKGDKKWDLWKFKSSKLIGGNWYSTQKGGDCDLTEGECKWRVVSTLKTLNASCVNHKIEQVVINEATCFGNKLCPVDNRTSDCWADCFYGTLLSGNALINQKTLVAAWMKAFDGGCPNIRSDETR